MGVGLSYLWNEADSFMTVRRLCSNRFRRGRMAVVCLMGTERSGSLRRLCIWCGYCIPLSISTANISSAQD
jgi:hypothetical protein